MESKRNVCYWIKAGTITERSIGQVRQLALRHVHYVYLFGGMSHTLSSSTSERNVRKTKTIAIQCCAWVTYHGHYKWDVTPTEWGPGTEEFTHPCHVSRRRCGGGKHHAPTTPPGAVSSEANVVNILPPSLLFIFLWCDLCGCAWQTHIHCGFALPFDGCWVYMKWDKSRSCALQMWLM